MRRGHRFVYPLIAGFFGGVILASLYRVSLPLLLFFILLAGVCLMLGCVRHTPVWFLMAIVLCGSVLGMARSMEKEASLPIEETEIFMGQEVILEGMIVEDPDLREGNTKLTILVDVVGTTTADFRILATVVRHPSFTYGDRIRLQGKLLRPEIFSEDGEHFFNYPKWLAKDGIVAQTTYPKVTLISSGGGSFIIRGLYKMKHAFVRNLNRLIGEPESGLLSGLLVGSKQALGKEGKEQFTRAGVIHVVVLSGYNVALVALAVMYLLSFLPLRVGIVVGGVAMILFVLMVGASATAVRATLMAILVLVAKMTGREGDALRILFIAAFLMAFHNPMIVVFDPSFQLSFLATLGLITLSPRLEKKLTWIPKRFGMSEIVSATIATQITVLPLLLWMSGLFSVVALPVNLLILPMVPLAMLCGFVTGVIGFISSLLALPFALITEIILMYQIQTVYFFASLPFSAFTLPAFPFMIVVICYALFGYWYIKTTPASRQ